eukprot:SAG11_NODE_15764_length_567_cov_0.792735_1_plen_39_part_01
MRVLQPLLRALATRGCGAKQRDRQRRVSTRQPLHADVVR